MLNEVVLALPREAASDAPGLSKRGAAIREINGNDGGCPPKMLGILGPGVPGVPGLPGVVGRLDSMSPVNLFVCSPGLIGR